MVWGIYRRFENKILTHLEEQEHRDLLQDILVWHSDGGVEEVKKRILEKVEQLAYRSKEDG